MPRTHIRLAALLAQALALTTLASAGVSDMYITNSLGEIYYVNGDTLQASPVAQLENPEQINDIQYIGNGKILANLAFALVTIDLNSGIQETLFTTNESIGQPGSFVYSSGLARRASGGIYFGATEILSTSGLINYGMSYDIPSGELTEVGSIPFTAGLDFYELANGNMIGFGTRGQSTLFNPNTGVVEATFDLNVSTAVSFVQSLDELFIMNAGGSLYSFDITDGSTEFYGRIRGFDDYILGATIASSSAALIPSPGSMMLLAGGLGFGFRRRR